MCGRLGVSGNIVVPGTVMQFSAGKRGQRIGVWGIPGANTLIHNARFESLSGYWARLKDNRGVLPVRTFIEPEGPIFGLKGHSVINLAVIYNEHNNFAVVTENSRGAVAGIHPRMPVIVTDNDKWVTKGELSDPPEEQIIILGDAGRDKHSFDFQWKQ